MVEFDLPEEDSLNSKARDMLWTKKNINKIDEEIEKLSKLISKNLNIKQIERLIK